MGIVLHLLNIKLNLIKFLFLLTLKYLAAVLPFFRPGSSFRVQVELPAPRRCTFSVSIHNLQRHLCQGPSPLLALALPEWGLACPPGWTTSVARPQRGHPPARYSLSLSLISLPLLLLSNMHACPVAVYTISLIDRSVHFCVHVVHRQASFPVVKHVQIAVS